MTKQETVFKTVCACIQGLLANPMTNDWTKEHIADEAIKQAELLVNRFYEKYNETC